METRVELLKEADEEENSESRESLIMWLGYSMKLPHEVAVTITEHIHAFWVNKPHQPVQ